MKDLPETPTKFRVDTRKIVDYLLNVDHRDGGPKAVFFLARGFSLDDVPEFARRLLDHPLINPDGLAKVVPDDFAPKFVYEGKIYCPDGSTPRIRTVWEARRNETHGRLVTAYPQPVPPIAFARKPSP